MIEYIAFLAGLAVGVSIMGFLDRLTQKTKARHEPGQWLIGKVVQIAPDAKEGNIVWIDGGIGFTMSRKSLRFYRIKVGSNVVLNRSEIFKEGNPN